MAERDYVSTPISDRLELHKVIKGLAQDLEDLRENQISIADAHARAGVAKQIWNGARIYLQGSKMLEQSAKPANETPTTEVKVNGD